MTLIVLNKTSQVNGLITGKMTRTTFTEIRTSYEKGLKRGLDFNWEGTVRTAAGRAKKEPRKETEKWRSRGQILI